MKRREIRASFIICWIYLLIIYLAIAFYYFGFTLAALLINFLFFHATPNIAMIFLLYFIFSTIMSFGGCLVILRKPDCDFIEVFETPKMQNIINKMYIKLILRDALEKIKEETRQEENK